MIEWIKLLNFQAWVRLSIRLTPVTTIIGDNDVGKSSLLRALRWLLTNQWSASYARIGTDETGAAASVGGVRIKRQKGKSGNTYVVGDHVLRAVEKPRGVVPDEVAAVARVSEANFQRAHDPYFWIGGSAPEIARRLNETFDLQLIDTSLDNAASAVRSERAKVKLARERLDLAEQKKAELSWAAELDEDFRELESLVEQLGAAEAGVVDLASKIEQLGAAEGRLREAAARTEAARRTARLGEGAVAASMDAQSLRELIDKLTEAEERAAESRAVAEGAAAELEAALAGRCPLCGRGGK